ncbi:unnamed protein product [Caenorhabditis brenneri]
MVGFGPQCTLAESQEPFNLMREYNGFMNYLSNPNETSFEEIVERCVHLNYYAPIVDRCYDYFDESMREEFVPLKKLCSTAQYLIGNFSKCDKKLEDKQCYMDWKKKTLLMESEKNKTETEKCLEKEISENCDKETWESFRENIIKFNSTVETPIEPESSQNELAKMVTGLISNGGKCSTSDHMVHSYADLGIMEFGKALKAMNVSSQADIKTLNGNCKLMEEIFLLYDRCNGFGIRTTRLICDSYKRLCSIVDFLDTKLKDCSKKLEESECYKNWRQQSISFEHISDEEKAESLMVVCCNCLKDEVTRICGVEDWEKFRGGIMEATDCDWH